MEQHCPTDAAVRGEECEHMVGNEQPAHGNLDFAPSADDRDDVVGVAKQAEGHPDVVLRGAPLVGDIVAKVPNGDPLTILAARGDSLKVKWKEVVGWAKESNVLKCKALDSQRYTSLDSILEAVDQSWISYVRGSYLVALHNQAQPISKHQMTPANQFWTHQEVLVNVPLCRDRGNLALNCARGFFLVALSYRWLERGHPDKKMHHLRIVAQFIAMVLNPGLIGAKDLAIFWDFVCLPQLPRDAQEQQRFKCGLRSLDVVYAHTETCVWQQTAMPDELMPGYDKSGWCFFESSISSLVKNSQVLKLDLGQSEFVRNISASVAIMIVVKCGVERSPPHNPHTFSEELDKRRFTGRGDKAEVKQLYAQIFASIVGMVTELRFEKCKTWTVEDWVSFTKFLPHCKCLRKLWLGDCQGLYGAEFATSVACVPKLEVLVIRALSGDGAKTLAAPLRTLVNLQKLSLGHSQIGYDGAKSLAASLPALVNLQELDLEDNQIGDDGAKSLAASLPALVNLHVLGLVMNQIGDDGAKSLAASLPALANLQVLELRENQIGDDGAKSLAASVPALVNLKLMVLSCNQIGDDGAKSLAASLPALVNLQQMNLCGNQIGDDGATSLAASLPALVNLQVLELRGNQIGDDGAKSLAASVPALVNLKRMDLTCNQIRKDATKRLAASLPAFYS